MDSELINAVTEAVFPENNDSFAEVDVLIVLGSYKVIQYKMPEAIRLYKSLPVKKLLFTGGNTCLSGQPEYEAMSEYALDHGVPDSDILLEPLATNTIENADLCSKLISSELPSTQSVALLTTAFHIKRAAHLFEECLPQSVRIYSCFVNDKHTRKDNWWLTESGKERVLHSYRTLSKQQELDKTIPDEDLL
ncbi:MAG: YdcF family protein [Endozoicomonas sp.]|uniref:YdcF family protein n=1 Tax=Endozoicomonas sp. TaxID=1892382 RepID=UPI003D9BA328